MNLEQPWSFGGRLVALRYHALSLPEQIADLIGISGQLNPTSAEWLIELPSERKN